MRPTLVAVALSLVTTLPAPAQTSGEPADVVRDFHAALIAGDSVRALSLLAPDVMIFESGGVESSRDEYMQHHLGSDMLFAGSVAREVIEQWTDESGDVAWVLSTSTTKGTFRDREIDSRGVETMLLRRTADGWRIVHIHWSSRRAG
jgi:ketosteroid isomerase-like protein